MPAAKKEQVVDTEVIWSPDPTVDEVVGMLRNQVAELNLQLMVTQIKLAKALERVNDLETPTGVESS